MTTLITLYSSDRCIGRCDANCYNATKTTCTCICGGLNHGVGLQKARQNTCQSAAKLINTMLESAPQPADVRIDLNHLTPTPQTPTESQ
jgi:hypothetical protein